MSTKKIFIIIGAILFCCLLMVSFLPKNYFFGVKKIYQNQGVYTEKESKSSDNIKKDEEGIQAEHKATILFGGDAMFDRYIRQMGEESDYGYTMKGVKDLMTSVDCVVFNLEGPITTNKSVSQYSEIGSRDNYIFTFDPKIVPALTMHNVCVVNIGNNHIGNFGPSGIEETKMILQEGGMSYIGDTGTAEEWRYVTRSINGVRLAFVNYNAFVYNAMSNTMQDMENVRDESDFIIVYTHWGEEYQENTGENEKIIAHQFIDNGADLIIGSHPHVIQNIENYQGKKIYYSLGNFVFDQYFSPQTKRGLMVGVTFNLESKEISFKDYHIDMQSDGTTVLKQ